MIKTGCHQHHRSWVCDFDSSLTTTVASINNVLALRYGSLIHLEAQGIIRAIQLIGGRTHWDHEDLSQPVEISRKHAGLNKDDYSGNKPKRSARLNRL
jgi:hypothetical protein